jgi:hypothetical protein
MVVKMLDLGCSDSFLDAEPLFSEDLSVGLETRASPSTLSLSSLTFRKSDILRKPRSWRSFRDCAQRWRGMLVKKLAQSQVEEWSEVGGGVTLSKEQGSPLTECISVNSLQLAAVDSRVV